MEKHTRSYLQLIKPGITISNTMTATAGYILAASIFGFVWQNLWGVVFGVAFVIASACVTNNMLDRDLDTRMKRTKGREIAAGKISLTAAALYAAVLGLVGFGVLMNFTNQIALILGVIAFVWYVVIYGVAKRTTPLSTIIGGVCGALPPLAGYVAGSGQIDAVAWTLFGLLMVWQLPHFYAISLFRQSDYKKAGLPVWSVRYGTRSTKAQILFWVFIFVLLAPVPTLLGTTGYFYLVSVLGVSVYWLYQGAQTYPRLDDVAWAKKMFGISLVVLLVLSAGFILGGYLP